MDMIKEEYKDEFRAAHPAFDHWIQGQHGYVGSTWQRWAASPDRAIKEITESMLRLDADARRVLLQQDYVHVLPVLELDLAGADARIPRLQLPPELDVPVDVVLELVQRYVHLLDPVPDVRREIRLRRATRAKSQCQSQKDRHNHNKSHNKNIFLIKSPIGDVSSRSRQPSRNP